MFQRDKVIEKILHFSIISLFISSTGAQWDNPWIVGPPTSSLAYGRVNLTSTTSDGILYAEEGIKRGVVLAILRYTGSVPPSLSTGCTNIIELGPPENNAVAIKSLKEFDFESGDLNEDTCVFVIFIMSLPIRALDFNMVDMNDNRPFFINYPNTALTFKENELGQIYDFDATDGDQGDNSTLLYTFKTLAGDGSNFTLNSSNGIFSVTKKLDFEAGQFYLFEISVADRGGLSSLVQVTLYVIDAKDSAPIWKTQVPFININEELAVNSPVFSVLAQDGDTINDEIVYSLVDSRASFSIDAKTGEVKIAQRIDRDVLDFDSYFDLEITATCKNYPQNKSVAYSTVFIDDVNDNLPVFDKSIYNFDLIDEGYVGRLTQMDILVSDPDLKDKGSYVMAIRGSPDVNQYVELSPTTGRNNGIFSLRINSPKLLDYEDSTKRNITFQVVATEVSGSQTSQYSTVNLFSRDINDNSPVFPNNYTANIVENLDVGSPVIKIQATDADVSSTYGQPSIRYSFVEIYDAARFFTIDEVTGEIHTAANIDRESIGSSSLKYKVQAIDKNGDYDGRRAVADLTIAIQDVNDDTPSFLPPSTVDFSVSEEKGSGSVVADFSASDRDENSNLAFTINWEQSKFYKNRALISDPSPEMKKTFTLDLESRAWNKQFWRVATTSTAVLKVGDSSFPPGNCNSCPSTPLDREVFDSVQLCLTVTDLNTAMGVDKDELYVVVNIADMNDNNPVFDQTSNEFSIVEGNATAVGTVFGYIRASDIDESNVITYSLNLCDNVVINAKNGQLSTTALIDREVNDVIECTVTATDNGNPTRSSTTSIRITVVDVNDNEPKLTVTPTQVVIHECSPKSSTKNGIMVSSLQATDADAGAYGTVSYMFSRQNVEGIDEFAIDLSTGEMTVRNCELLDFDTKISYSVIVEARDNYREGITLGSLSDFERINITLLDVNDNAPTLTSPGSLNECYRSPLESLTMGQEVASVEGSDADSNGPNKWLTFTLHGQNRLGNSPSEKCDRPFRMETVNNSTGKLVVAVSDILNCTGIYDVIVQACDQGDSIEGVQCSSNTTYRICVLDVNNNNPQFIFPEKDNSIFEVREDSSVGQPLFYNATNQQLIFKATDNDEGLNGQILYTWLDDSVNQVFALSEDTGQVYLSSKLNRSVASYYDLIIVATDQGTPPLSTRMNLRINVRLSNKQLPYFPVNSESLTFTENEMEVKVFQKAEDPDNGNLYPGESRYDVCYYLVCGNSEYFDVPDKTLNQLHTKKPLDREQPLAVPYVTILATNDCTNKPVLSCSDIDATKGQYLNIAINVKDVNDCDPVFSGSLSGVITEGNARGTRVFPMTITDEDDNDVVTCKIEESFTVSQSSVNLGTVSKPPFSISSDYWIVLEFTVQPEMKGYFTLNVTCLDKVAHSSRTPINIYVVAQENKVDIVFDNKKEEIEAKRSEIEKIFTETMGYKCNVEKVLSYEGVGKPDGNNTFNTALSYFIDVNKTEPEPVLASVIFAKKGEPGIETLLRDQCSEVGLTLEGVGPLPTEEKNTSEQMFQMLFIIACVVLILMIGIILFFAKRTSELNRRVAALAVPKFGSQDSGINPIAETVLNSNVYAVQGSNPIYSIEHSSNSNHDDSFDKISQSSGDSIFIGVEDNPEFKDYLSKGINGKANNGIIHEVASLPFEVVSRRNPLMDRSLDEEKPEPNHPPPPPPRTVKRPAPPVPVLYEDDDGDYAELDASNNIDSNFSFGDVTMTAI
ncbi:cadherin-23-like [Daphnia carinata]|uniref:cadherin-23-like n=1 Tax=Daphnia carinata TaxID=120202 RepID=UPI00257B2CE6|nr:cadherin-23-like [Daphnia carinata]